MAGSRCGGQGLNEEQPIASGQMVVCAPPVTIVGVAVMPDQRARQSNVAVVSTMMMA